jgi:hypothetical protein
MLRFRIKVFFIGVENNCKDREALAESIIRFWLKPIPIELLKKTATNNNRTQFSKEKEAS